MLKQIEIYSMTFFLPFGDGWLKSEEVHHLQEVQNDPSGHVTSQRLKFFSFQCSATFLPVLFFVPSLSPQVSKMATSSIPSSSHNNHRLLGDRLTQVCARTSDQVRSDVLQNPSAGGCYFSNMKLPVSSLSPHIIVPGHKYL